MFDEEGALIHQMKESKKGALINIGALSLKWSTFVVHLWIVIFALMFDKEGALLNQGKESDRWALTKRGALFLKWSTFVVHLTLASAFSLTLVY